ncbi:HNH endonuclease [Bradyrhizobium sp. ma5]|uniref:HNH endonuclease n=1 Tax=Bradyrhizobium sp. ma5 TaxID=3344828 RepID=UPI0035D485BE
MRIFLRDLYTCQRKGCGKIEGDMSVLVCDHIRPHRGNETLFWDESNLRMRCKACHDSNKQREKQQSLATCGVWH